MKVIKCFVILLVLICFTTGAEAGYTAGDVVSDETFKESDGGSPVTNSIYDIIDSGKVLIMEFGATW